VKKLSINIQSFEEIRTKNYYYADKTPFVKNLTDKEKYCFLSCPRRFGKSLFLDTLKQAFLGKKNSSLGFTLKITGTEERAFL